MNATARMVMIKDADAGHDQVPLPPSKKTCVTVQEGYERWAPTYDRDPNPLLVLEERHLNRMIPPVEGKRVLDLACGTGRWLGRLTARGAHSAVGVDLSGAMLAVARQKPGVKGRVVQADCRAMPFADAEFDLITCSFAMAHWREIEAAAGEVRRVAAAGADVYVSDLHPLAHAQGWRTGFRDHRGAAEISTWPRSTQEIAATWISAGFECASSIECQFGEPERAIFIRAGRAHTFEDCCRIPGILILHLKRQD